MIWNAKFLMNCWLIGCCNRCPSYKVFVMNYNMQGVSKSLSKIFVVLKTTEVEIKKEHAVLKVKKFVDFKKSGGKAKGKK